MYVSVIFAPSTAIAPCMIPPLTSPLPCNLRTETMPKQNGWIETAPTNLEPCILVFCSPWMMSLPEPPPAAADQSFSTPCLLDKVAGAPLYKKVSFDYDVMLALSFFVLKKC